ncbi:ATP-binding cassette domain-containing protein [Nonomuraea recticatena]|uniref:ATP-binding cassette domain-containing protein n=1 Tax=Nonomuraea recticatena TaxID=46178 RepID=UPI003610627E
MGRVLSMTGIGKSFLGVRVLAEVDLAVAAGQVHAVVGENGAGKSTLMKILAGVHAPDTGTITIDGRQVSFGHPLDAQRAGVAIIYQEFTLLPERSVAENVFLGREPLRRGLVDRAAMDTATASLLAGLGEDSFGPRDPVKRLSVAQQQVVEIVKALSLDARIVVMDEPTAALAEHEVELLYRLVRRLQERGIAVLYISHRLREVFDLASEVTVLKDGRLVSTVSTSEVTSDDLVRLMVGRDLGTYFPLAPPPWVRCG